MTTESKEKRPAGGLSTGRAPRGVSRSIRTKGLANPREQMQVMTRARIVASTRELLQSAPFHHVMVEDIVKAAGISRATFYLHYKCKEEVLRDILIEDFGSEASLEKIRRLLAIKKIDKKSIIRWIISVQKMYKSKRKGIMSSYLAYDYDPNFYNEFARIRDMYVELLGKRFEYFNLDGLDEIRREERRVACYLLFYQLEQVALHSAFPGWNLKREVVHDQLAEKFLAVLT